MGFKPVFKRVKKSSPLVFLPKTISSDFMSCFSGFVPVYFHVFIVIIWIDIFVSHLIIVIGVVYAMLPL